MNLTSEIQEKQLQEKQSFDIVVAGQMPPPVGGQNLNIKRVHDLLAAEPDLRVGHLRFAFTKDWSQMRQGGLSKLIEVVRVWGRAIKLRRQGKIRVLLFPAGGPHKAPLMRDFLLLPLLALLSERLVVHFRAAGLKEYLDESPSWFRALTRFCYGKFASEALVLAPLGKQDALAANLEKITVIPNAVEDSASEFLAQNAEQIKPASLEKRRKVILSVGHICPDKGSPELIAAFGQVFGEAPDYELRIIGETLPSYPQEQFEADIQATGIPERIIHRGLLRGEELQREYQNADLFVFSSVAPYESFGMVMIEAMQWSLPMVVTNWRANAWVAGENHGGVLAENPQEDLVKSLSEALEQARAQESQWPAWGQKNRQEYEKRYRIEVMRESFRKLVIKD